MYALMRATARVCVYKQAGKMPQACQRTRAEPTTLCKETASHLVAEGSDLLPSCWAEAPIKIARMTLTIKLDGNWSSFQLANSTPPLSVTGSAIAPSARMSLACGRSNSPKTQGHCARNLPTSVNAFYAAMG